MNALRFAALVSLVPALLLAQAGPGGQAAAPPQGPGGFGPGGPGGGPGGFGGGGPGGRGGFDPFSSEERKVLAQYDLNKDGRLNLDERKTAFEALSAQNPGRGGGFGGFGGRGGQAGPSAPGARLTAADVKRYDKEDIYDTSVLRTYFIEFEDADWEKRMAAFNNTDIEMPARVTVDGRAYNDVGIHFRGLSSFAFIADTYKRSLNLSFDFVNEDQNLGGYRTFNLLNSNGDPTLMRGVLFLEMARSYIPAAKANFVRVVINGENWGIYQNVQQFNKEMVNEWFQTTKGARIKVPGNPNGQGTWAYLGDDPALYKETYQLKTAENPKVWQDFISMLKVLNETPADRLEAAITPLLDVDGALRFLALDNVVLNDDGFWIRASDYNIYQETNGRFHILPHDANEAFLAVPTQGPGGFGGRGFGGPGGRGGRGGAGPGGPDGRGGPPAGGPNAPAIAGAPGGRGVPPPGAPQANGPAAAAVPPAGPGAGDQFVGRGGPGGPGRGGPGGGAPGVVNENVEYSPLALEKSADRALVSKLLAVPAFKAKYLGYVKEMATTWLDWNKLGPIVQRHRALIADDVARDTKKNSSNEAFLAGTANTPGPSVDIISLRNFADKRRAYLLKFFADLEGAK